MEHHQAHGKAAQGVHQLDAGGPFRAAHAVSCTSAPVTLSYSRCTASKSAGAEAGSVSLPRSASVISLVTYFMDMTIVFGVLHLLASCMLLFGLTRGFWEALPAWVLPVLCLALIFLTAPCADGVTTQTPQLWLFGFTTPDFASADYFPLLPWFFVFLLGTWAGRYVKAGRLPQWFYTARAPRLALVGRHALLLYVLHQPLLYALTMLLRLIFIR